MGIVLQVDRRRGNRRGVSTGLLAPVTTIFGAAISANLVLIIRSVSWDCAGRPGQDGGDSRIESVDASIHLFPRFPRP